jgi:hypothetical protein
MSGTIKNNNIKWQHKNLYSKIIILSTYSMKLYFTKFNKQVKPLLFKRNAYI